MPSFNIGDRVSYPGVGLGTVRHIRDTGSVGVEFDNPPSDFSHRLHNLQGRLDGSRGRYFMPYGSSDRFDNLSGLTLVGNKPKVRLLKGYAKFARENYALSSG